MRNLYFIFVIISSIYRSQDLNWIRIYDSSTNYHRFPKQIEVSQEKKIAVMGVLAKPSPTLYSSCFVQCNDSSGNKIWSSELLSTKASEKAGLAFNSQNEIFVGLNFKDSVTINENTYLGNGAAVVKYLNNGQISWIKYFADARLNDICTDKYNNTYLLFTLHDTCLIYGHNFIPKGLADLLILKINPNDLLISVRQLKGYALGKKIRITEKNNIFIFGEHTDTLYVGNRWFDWSHKGSPDDFVLKMDQSGSVVTFSYACNDFYGGAISAAFAPNERSAVTGWTCHHGCFSSFASFDSTGSKNRDGQGLNAIGGVSGMTFNDPGSLWCFQTEIHYSDPQEAPSTTTRKNLSLIKLNPVNSIVKRDTIGIPGIGSAATSDNNGAIYITSGISPGENFVYHNISIANTTSLLTFFVAKLHDNLDAIGIETIEKEKTSVSIYPNPSANYFLIKGKELNLVTVRNIFGTVIQQKIMAENTSEAVVDLTLKPKGIYFIEITSSNHCEIKKIVLE